MPRFGYVLSIVCFVIFLTASAAKVTEPRAAEAPPNTASWHLAAEDVSPSGRSDAAMAYDNSRGRVVFFGGIDSSYRGDTWERDGTTWVKKTPPSSPTVRASHAMAYDSARGRVVLFGGVGDSGRLDDTWEWDGGVWSEKTPVVSPSARYDAVMTYDSARGRVVLFGGVDASGRRGDTWEWDGSAWVEMKPVASPQARSDAAMTYDSARGRVVLFGGLDSALSWRSDTWEWDGSEWAEKTPGTSPLPRSGHALAYDSARSRVVLFGGFNESHFPGLGDTWEWDGTTWVFRTVVASPSARNGPAMVYDPARERIVLFGGYDGSIHGSRGDTWEWDGAAWAETTPATSPSVRAGPAMAYDRARERVVLFGGVGGSGPCGDTWEWNGTAWVEKTPALSPSPRFNAAMAYDSARERVVLFGGVGDSDRLGDTWEWDGTAWIETSPATSPPARFNAAMAYDTARGRVVLFGGDAGSAGFRGDTWEWDGSLWLKKTPAVSPSARTASAIACDSVHGRVVLFGGADESGPRDDTWEWDGTAWVETTPATSPPARFSAAMVHDSARTRTVLFGGDDSHGFGLHSDTWGWDGTEWVQDTPATRPSARRAHAMAYDSARKRIVLFGGEDTSGFRGDTWERSECGADSDCDDTNPCTGDSCTDGGTCSNVPASGTCDDGNACTFNDACSGGSCVGTMLCGKLQILSPAAGETIDSGDLATIQWQAPSAAASFALEYSTDNGDSWKAIATGVVGRSYGWVVPAQADNRPKSRLRITSRNASNARTRTDVSAAPFRIEVVKLDSPNGGESLSSGAVAPVVWTTHATLRPVARVRLDYSISGGAAWKRITTLAGNPGAFSWIVPTVGRPHSNCEVRVVFLDPSGKDQGKDVNDAVFTIHP